MRGMDTALESVLDHNTTVIVDESRPRWLPTLREVIFEMETINTGKFRRHACQSGLEARIVIAQIPRQHTGLRNRILDLTHTFLTRFKLINHGRGTLPTNRRMPTNTRTIEYVTIHDDDLGLEVLAELHKCPVCDGRWTRPIMAIRSHQNDAAVHTQEDTMRELFGWARRMIIILNWRRYNSLAGPGFDPVPTITYVPGTHPKSSRRLSHADRFDQLNDFGIAISSAAASFIFGFPRLPSHPGPRCDMYCQNLVVNANG